jgi:hypothetical protein
MNWAQSYSRIDINLFELSARQGASINSYRNAQRFWFQVRCPKRSRSKHRHRRTSSWSSYSSCLLMRTSMLTMIIIIITLPLPETLSKRPSHNQNSSKLRVCTKSGSMMDSSCQNTFGNLLYHCRQRCEFCFVEEAGVIMVCMTRNRSECMSKFGTVQDQTRQDNGKKTRNETST